MHIEPMQCIREIEEVRDPYTNLSEDMDEQIIWTLKS